MFAKCKVYNNVQILCYVFHTHVGAFYGMEMKFTLMLGYSDMCFIYILVYFMEHKVYNNVQT